MTVAEKETSISSASLVDPYYNDLEIRKSWYYEGSHRSDIRIDIAPVWDDYIGTGITVGVIDSQIDFEHKDLEQAYDVTLDYNFATESEEAERQDAFADRHGTLVAGVISSEADNNLGTAGIAHGATLVGLTFDYASTDIVAHAMDALRAGASLDVVNASWSFTKSFSDNFGTKPQYAEPLEITATTGRDGLGTTVVFAAGNSGTKGSSNYHNFQNSPYTIAVGAVERDGDPANFTSLGANVLLSAGGVDVFTTAQRDDYVQVQGTSFAAPAVSAVAALMLEANGALGYRDVQQILAASAMREGLTDKKLHGDGWQYNGVTTHNGGAMHFSDAFGFGFLNAHAAVRLAETWTLQQTAANRSTVTAEVKTDLALAAGDIDHVSVDIEIGEPILAEHVQVTLELDWAQNGDIDVYLTSPTGTTVRLMYDLPNIARVGNINDFAFTSVASMGEMAKGTWTLEVYNRNPDAENKDGQLTGSLTGVSLEVHGRTENLEDDVHIFTDEFGTLFSGQDLADRRTLRDEDGGVDTINAAAVTSNSVIDLSGVSASTIAGVQVDIRAGDFENVFTGDGDDTLTGDAQDNWLSAGRGSDVLVFSAGSDTLDGGAGVDRLVLDFSSSAVLASVGSDGSLLIGFDSFGQSLVTDIEFFEFSDVTLSVDAFLGGPTPVPAPPGSGVSDPVVDDPVVDDPVVDDPVVDDPVVDDPVVDDPVTDDPVGDLPGDVTFDGPFTGDAGDDKMRGTDGNNRIEGLAGDDRLYGDRGSDLIIGGDGDDVLFGDTAGDNNDNEQQADIFVFDSADGKDRIFDFEVEFDSIALVDDPLADAYILTQSGSDNVILTYGETQVILYDAGTFTERGQSISELAVNVYVVDSVDDLL